MEESGPHRVRQHRKLTCCLPRVQGVEACRPASVAAEREVQAPLPAHVWHMLTVGCGRSEALQPRHKRIDSIARAFRLLRVDRDRFTKMQRSEALSCVPTMTNELTHAVARPHTYRS